MGREDWMREMRVYRLSELREFFNRHRCPWCESVDRPARLAMHSYDHSGGVGVIKEDSRMSIQWVYGVCETCEHQWAMRKLMSMDELMIQTEDFYDV